MSPITKVIKADSLTDMLAADQFNYEDLKARCEQYLESVREQTRQMLVQAQEEVNQIKKQAGEQGRQEGIAQGLKEAEKQNNQAVQKKAQQIVQKKIQNVVPLLQQASQQLEHEKQACLSRWESQAIELVIAITEKVIHRSLNQTPEIVKERIEEVLKLTVGNSQITIRIAEEDMETLEEFQETVIGTLSQHANVKLIGDTNFTSGDVVVTTEHGVVDARIKTQLERIADELLGD